MLAGPSETGKTVAALWRLNQLLQSTPKAQAALVRKVAADVTPTVLVTLRRMLEISRCGAVPYGGRSPEWFDYPNGARLYIGGMDRPGKVLSGERDWIYVNQAEELTLEDWETLSTRTTGRGARTKTPMLFGDCNPGPPTHWILGRPRLRVLYSKHEDNPSLFDDSGTVTAQGKKTLDALDSLTGARRERLRFGRWASSEGVVYESWNRSIHLVKRFEIPPEWTRFCSVDFGYTNPFVCQWWAQDGDGRMYLYREIYRTKTLVEDHARSIEALSAGENIVIAVCDHDAEDRATLERHGISTLPAYKGISVGIEAVQARLRVAGDGKPRLFVFDDALVDSDPSLAEGKKPLCTAQEIESYVWPKGADGKAVKEVPVKVCDHGMDAMRYAVAYADDLGGFFPSITSLTGD
jgi:phage terminase large subunit